MKNIVDVKIDGREAHILKDSVEKLREAGFEVESNESDSNKSMFVTIIEAVTEMPELYSYMLGVFATLLSILAVIINYNFYGKLYEYHHNKKK